MPGKRIDLIGQQFDKLTVISRNKERDNGYFAWLCKCDCGNTISVDTRRLKRGTIKNCGCVPKLYKKNGPIPEDITGQKFNNLTAIKRESSHKGRTRWVCECDCGNTVITSTKNLKDGKVKSCGCLKLEKPYGNWNDLTGKKFGRLTVIEVTDKRDYRGSIYWKCKCKCGNIVEVSNSQLVSKNVVSCGCKKKEINQTIHDQLTFTDNTCIEFLKHRKHRNDNTSGFRGVSQKGKKYRVNIGFKGKTYHLGTYESFEEAKKKRLEAEELIHNQYIRLFEIWNNHARGDSDYELKSLIFDVEVESGKVCISSPYLNFIGGDSS